jgi:hypothetical protein
MGDTQIMALSPQPLAACICIVHQPRKRQPPVGTHYLTLSMHSRAAVHPGAVRPALDLWWTSAPAASSSRTTASVADACRQRQCGVAESVGQVDVGASVQQRCRHVRCAAAAVALPPWRCCTGCCGCGGRVGAGRLAVGPVRAGGRSGPRRRAGTHAAGAAPPPPAWPFQLSSGV